MELEQVRTKREQLKNEINTAEQSIFNKRDELKKLETAIEIMER